jgi:membrane-associated phospholipid phosphatase
MTTRVCGIPGLALNRPASGRPVCRALVLLADPSVRLGLGVAGVMAAGIPVRRDRVGRREAALFLAVNGLPDLLFAPAWAVMQAGALGAALAAALAAWATGDEQLARRFAASGVGTWALAKLVKERIRRPRPASLLAATRTRGPEASGSGYLSGHAGVVAALCAASFHRLSGSERALALGMVAAVGLSRMYVGAHLPLDVVGGVSLGLAADAAVALAQCRSAE